MGPRSVERGKRVDFVDVVKTRVASMGPRSVERGKGINIVGGVRHMVVLQWGRVLLNAESVGCEVGAGNQQGFNGAAFC